MKQVTIYSDSEFGGCINKYEGKLIEFGTRPYAQYKKTPYVTFIPTRKRYPRQILKGYKPFILILDGVGHPQPPSAFNEPVIHGLVTVYKSKYLSFDERYDTDFDTMIDKYIVESGARVIADYRHTKGFNSN